MYFLVNLSDSLTKFEARLGAGPHVIQMDPQTGAVSQTEMRQPDPKSPEIHLRPHQSMFVLCSHLKLQGAASELNPELDTARKLTGLWHLTFDGPDAPRSRDMSDLESWTTWADAKHFSGQGIYTSTFEWNGAVPTHCRLRFDSVHEAAEVWINGKSAGVAWMPPYELVIGSLLRQGTNTIGVTVGNVPANRFIGLPDEDLKPLRTKYGNRFPDPQEKRVMKEPALSGLIGNVWLVYNKDFE